MLDDGTGQIAPALHILFTALTTQEHARSARIWLIVNPDVTELLCALATGTAPLEHDTFTRYPRPKKVEFVRDLLVEHRILPPYDRDIERFTSWLEHKISTATAEQSTLIRQYARWVHLNRMHHLLEIGALKPGTMLAARQSTSTALEFLRFLTARGKPPIECAQNDIDAWLAAGPTTHSLARGFIRWAAKNGHLPAIEAPYRVAKTSPIVSQTQRLELLRQIVTDTTLDSALRAAAVFFLLLGQPVTRIATMTIDQVETDENGVSSVRVTDTAVILPPPFDSIIQQHLAALPHQTTSTHTTQRWLFSGARPGRHINQSALMAKLRRAGLDLQGAKNATIRALVIDLPAPIVADTLGYSYPTTDRHRRDAGATFIDYINKRRVEPRPEPGASRESC
ncbi:MAG: hypothetical protein JWQ19_1605 [Subtercola sp.]|nr:hypothetical protein [Subtercola sp.]